MRTFTPVVPKLMDEMIAVKVSSRMLIPLGRVCKVEKGPMISWKSMLAARTSFTGSELHHPAHHHARTSAEGAVMALSAPKELNRNSKGVYD